MATFNEIITRLRRYLRDPDGDIWTDDELLLYFNQSQLEIQQKTWILARAETYRYPPEYRWSYMWDLEYAQTDGDRFQCLAQWQAGDMIVCFPWEPGYWMSGAGPPDDGHRYTHPWESGLSTQSDALPIKLHARLHKTIFAAYDEEQITPTTQKEVAENDRWYRTRTGQALNYYILDEGQNLVALYPHPPIVWDDWDEGESFYEDVYSADNDWAYQWDWEVAGQHVNESEFKCIQLVGEFSGILYLYDWEEDHADSNPDGATVLQRLQSIGGIDSSEFLDHSDFGIPTDTINTKNSLFLIYEYIPDDLQEISESTTFPDWLNKYVEYATLERCFGADTDGFIPSLRDYWQMRKNIGVAAIKRFRQKRLVDRDFRMGAPARSHRGRRPTLPAGYPAQWP